MENFVEKLKKYFEETPREKVLEDWEKTKEWDNVGITVEEFLKNTNDNIKKNDEGKLRLDVVIKNEVAVCKHHKTCCYPRDSGETCLPQKGCFEQQTVL